ncbi:MAG: hypothetical protein K2P85_00195 [Flavobacteriaceae bacterium]|nr:hypothetical protein [Flavobacteriaceae bacterium]
MKNIFILLFLITITLIGCKTNQRQNGLKHGKWITYDSINNDSYKYVEHYKKGEEVRTWKTFKNKKIYKKEVFLKDSCQVIYYNVNKKIILKGQTMSVQNEKETHWFYFGNWNYYDENGKLILIKTYRNGELISEKEIK